MNGVILVNKDINRTSRDIVNDISHILNIKKVGHTGTLDPLATGVLVITVGRYTKLNEVLTSTYKEYIAEFILGTETDSLDITGNITDKKEVNLDVEKIREVISSFEGTYNQVVPLYSAVKVNGKKLYEYARNNEDVDVPSRMVDIKSIEILSIKDNLVKIKVLVSKGTYIRSLIRDIGSSLGVGATMTSLVRTKQGQFDIEDTVNVEDIRNGELKLLKLEDIMDLEVIDADNDLYFKVINGSKIDFNYNKEYVLFKYKGEEICLYKRDEKIYRMYLKIKID